MSRAELPRGGNWDRPCFSCGLTPADGAEFSMGSTAYGKVYRKPRCKTCRAAKKRAALYNMESAELELLLNATVCPICNRDLDHGAGKGRSSVIDHCHVSGDVRGVLCQACNKGLGMFGDDPNVLQSAITYLHGQGR